jgi:phage tail sheath protein FI
MSAVRRTLKNAIDFDFTPPYPAEHITFRSHLVNDYLVEILPDVA